MLSTISTLCQRLVAIVREERGQALAEYGLILALIAVVAIAALTALGIAVAGKLDAISAAL